MECTLSVEPELEFDSSSESKTPLKVSREHLAAAQREDPTLVKCVKAADLGQAPKSGVMYFWDDGLLMRRWKPDIDDENCQEIQQNYSVIEKEALAMLMALQHFEVYIGGSVAPILVYTDHNPLIFLERMSNSNQRLMRWSLAIQEFNLDIRYKRGSENVVADALSRS